MENSLNGGWYSNGGGQYYNRFTGQTVFASDFNDQVLPSVDGIQLSSEATQAIITAMNDLHASTAKLGEVELNRYWYLPLVMAHGFDNFIFQYNRETGLFYAPWTDIQIDPIAILAESLASENNSHINRAIDLSGAQGVFSELVL